jgi:hypothetical protein
LRQVKFFWGQAGFLGQSPADGLNTAIIGPHGNIAVEPAPENWQALGISCGNLSIFDGTLYDGPFKETKDLPLVLAHGEQILIGRQEGGETEYLDPRYQPTQQMPGTQQRIVINPRDGKDTAVSRGHFTLLGSPFGILFINGVPRRGGGIRPPVNGTILLIPEMRFLGKGEEYLIMHGMSIRIRLPNNFEVEIAAA